MKVRGNSGYGQLTASSGLLFAPFTTGWDVSNDGVLAPDSGSIDWPGVYHFYVWLRLVSTVAWPPLSPFSDCDVISLNRIHRAFSTYETRSATGWGKTITSDMRVAGTVLCSYACTHG